MSPEGIEPPSQEPESYVISITLRRLFRKAQLLHYILAEFYKKDKKNLQVMQNKKLLFFHLF
ncbi:hypothetical protein CMALT394_30269 [Carnobacterium maltaromaticum]|nr:hypothetical protein CMALT394_30269 [Carnobacterium maltaromaticum]